MPPHGAGDPQGEGVVRPLLRQHRAEHPGEHVTGPGGRECGDARGSDDDRPVGRGAQRPGALRHQVDPPACGELRHTFGTGGVRPLPAEAVELTEVGGEDERGVGALRMLRELRRSVAVHVECVGIEHQPRARRAQHRDHRGRTRSRPESGARDDGIEPFERDRVDGVDVECALRVGRKTDGHERRVQRSDLGTDRLGDGEGDQSRAGSERAATGEHRSTCGPFAPGDDEHAPATALLRRREGTLGARCLRAQRPPLPWRMP